MLNPGYYPMIPAYPSYPYTTLQPYYPLQAPLAPYSYNPYTNGGSSGGYMPNPALANPVPNYAYTSPYNPNQPAMPG
ncbi:MAG TPA: hypothetical protein PLM98_18350, partial [Thiolinea sp.]|nr:hypothetical protein [Thiolinea sp.]